MSTVVGNAQDRFPCDGSAIFTLKQSYGTEA